MACYSFANCALDNAPYLTHFASLYPSVMNMRTEGILRLLTGESFAMHPDDKSLLQSSAAWADFLIRYKYTDDPHLKTFDVFPAMQLETEDVFLWPPFADTLCPATTARCTDGSSYPYASDPIDTFFPHIPWKELPAHALLWKELGEKLQHVRRKAVILYPPDTIQPPLFEAQHAENLRQRIMAANKRAYEILQPMGWKVFAPRAVLDPGEVYWAHYSQESTTTLHKEIAESFDLAV